MANMKKFLSYIVRSFCLSAIATALITFFEALYYYSNSVEKTSFSSPVFVALFCGIIYPICNLAVILPLYKYKFTKIEVILESICLVNVTAYIEEVITFFVPQDHLWVHKTVCGSDSWERVWWYDSSLNILYGICITLLLCLLYIKVKKTIIRLINKRRTDNFGERA
jgi:hypothetical protein